MSEEKNKILIVEGSVEFAEKMRGYFEEIKDTQFNLKFSQNLSGALFILDNEKCNLIIIDPDLDDGKGLEPFFAVRGRAGNIPIIVVTTKENAALGKNALDKGAYAHLIKNSINAKQIERLVKYAIVKSSYSRDKFAAVAKREMEIADLDQNRQLFILYRVAREINSSLSLSNILEEIISLILDSMAATRGAIFLMKENGLLVQETMRVKNGEKQPNIESILSILKKALQENTAVICSDSCYLPEIQEDSSAADTIKSVLAVPISDKDEQLGAIYLDNPGVSNAFNEDNMDMLTSIASQIALRVRQEKLQEQMREAAIIRASLERFHSPDVANLIYEQSLIDDGFQRFLVQREVTILFADISNSTGLLERLDPTEAADLLNRYFSEMSGIIFRYKGTVDKFIGDAIMATFGAPISYGNDAELAVFAATYMMKEMETFKLSLEKRMRFDIRIGVNTGMVMSGYLGSKLRLDYTVIGDSVNIAARLQENAPPQTIHVGEETYARASGTFQFRELGLQQLKGKKKQIAVYEVIY